MKFSISLCVILAFMCWEFSQSSQQHLEEGCHPKEAACTGTLLSPAPQCQLTAMENSKTKETLEQTNFEKIGSGIVSDYIPYQVSIQMKIGNRKVHICGGSVYSSDPNSKTFNKIITAAHCFANNNGPWTVVAGIKNLDEDRGARQDSDVCDVIVHEDYNQFEVDSIHDIAIMTLVTPLRKVSKRIEAISVTPVEPAYLSGTAQVSGWGITFESPTEQNMLQVANVSLKSCIKNNVNGGSFVICAGGQNEPDACEGDSGGPLVCSNIHNGATYLCGIVSNGPECEIPDLDDYNDVGVYTNVSAHLDWISANEKGTC